MNLSRCVKKARKEEARHRLSLSGNTLAEYGLAAALILILAIGGIMIFSGDLNRSFAALKEDMLNRNATVAAENGANLVNGANLNKPKAMTPAQQSSLQDELATKLQTSGANGTTQLLANQIEQTAELMLEAGKIDETQYGILMDLANQGHKMATVEGMIEDALKMANGDFEKFKSIQFQGVRSFNS